MKIRLHVFALSAGVFLALGLFAHALSMEEELHGEVDSLQVQLHHKNGAHKKVRYHYKRVNNLPPADPFEGDSIAGARQQTVRYRPFKVAQARPQARQHKLAQVQAREQDQDQVSDVSLRWNQTQPSYRQSNSIIRRWNLTVGGYFDFTDGGDVDTTHQTLPAGLHPTQWSDTPLSSVGARITADLGFFHSDHLTVQTGLAYFAANFSYEVSPYGPSYNNNVNTSSLYTGYGISSVYSTVMQVNYLGVPIELQLRTRPTGSSFYFRGGLMPAFAIGTNMTADDPVGISAYPSYGSLNNRGFGDINTFNLMIDGGLGYAFELGDSWLLNLGLSGYHGVIPVGNQYSTYPFSLGVDVGLSYSL